MPQNDGIIPALHEALAPPPKGVAYTVRTATLNPEEAAEILSMMSYPRQRPIQPSHVGMIADMMVAGQFPPGSLLTFALMNNIPKLVDGQHRLQAIVNADWTGDWIIRCLWSEEFNATTLYTVMDTSQKPRSTAIVGRAVGYEQLSSRLQNAIIAAARYQNLWRAEYEMPPFCNTPPVRHNIDRANERLTAFERADQIIADRNATSYIRRWLATPMILAIMVETLTKKPWDADEFWTKVATTGGGVANELRNALVHGPPTKASKYYNARLAAHGWNQRQTKSKMRRENWHELAVEGTSLTIPV